MVSVIGDEFRASVEGERLTLTSMGDDGTGLPGGRLIIRAGNQYHERVLLHGHFKEPDWIVEAFQGDGSSVSEHDRLSD